MAAADHTRMPALLTGIDAPTAETTLTATSIATATATAVAAMGDVGMRTAEMSQSGARVEMWPGMSVDEKGGMIGMEIGPETGAATVEGTEGTQTGSGTLYGTPAAHVTRLGASGENWGGNVTTGALPGPFDVTTVASRDTYIRCMPTVSVQMTQWTGCPSIGCLSSPCHWDLQDAGG